MSLKFFTCTMLLLGTVSLLPDEAYAQTLKRRAALGASFQPGQGGTMLGEIQIGGTASRLGLRAGDTIISFNGRSEETPQALSKALSGARAGDKISIGYRRKGQRLVSSGVIAGRPLERYAGAHTRYGAVQFRGGLLRDILILPADPKAPVVFMLPGYPCASIEATDSQGLYAGLARSFAAANIGFYRVEKPGVGDSLGGPACRDIDFETELDGFRAAYRHLIHDLHISPDRIFMLGHSLGGLQAPLLAQEISPRGVAVYGTLLRNWADYIVDLIRFQDFVIQGADPVATAERAEKAAGAIRRVLSGSASPQVIADTNPATAGALKQHVGWDGGERLWGRHYRFMQQLSGLGLVRAWRGTRSNVLSLYGTSDAVALFDHDQEMIAEVVNWYRPGTAKFVPIANTMHLMDLVGDRQELRRRNFAAGKVVTGPFNPEVARHIVAWIQESMDRAPVKQRTFPAILHSPTDN